MSDRIQPAVHLRNRAAAGTPARFRRLSIALLVLVLCSGCNGKPEAPVSFAPLKQPAHEKTMVAVGDSLTEGLGVAEKDAYPARLERKLKAAGYPFRVINAGVSGETSSGTLSRIDWILTLEPDIVILETGANDGLRGVDPALTRKNIDAIVRRLKDAGVTVVLAGMKMGRNLGDAFTRSFSAIYPAVAEKHGVVLMPFFLEDVAADPRWNQSDGIHPTAEGYRVVADNVFPYVLKAIETAFPDIDPSSKSG